MKNFNELTSTKKGNVGESIVDEYFTNKGYTIYKPVTDNAHSFDRLISYKKKN